jgi:hypothetical protein
MFIIKCNSEKMADLEWPLRERPSMTSVWVSVNDQLLKTRSKYARVTRLAF